MADVFPQLVVIVTTSTLLSTQLPAPGRWPMGAARHDVGD